MPRVTTCLVLGTLLLAGCALHRPALFRATNSLPEDPRLSSLERARLLQDQGDHLAATVEFRKVLASEADVWEREEAKIGAAKSLIRTHRYAPAMAILAPLPVLAESDHDCRKLALAGEILLRQHRAEEAESCLELALDGCPLEAFVPPPTVPGQGGHAWPAEFPPLAAASLQTTATERLQDAHGEVIPPGVAELEPIPEPAQPLRLEPQASGPATQPVPFLPADAPLSPPWLAGCCANLGLAYLKNDKPEKAAVMYAFAAHLARQRGQHLDAERAQRVHDELDSVLRQYAPYKPHPVSQRFPPGRQ